VDLEAYHSGTLLDGAWSASGNETISFATSPSQVYVVVLTGWGGYDSRNPVPSPGRYTATVTFASP